MRFVTGSSDYVILLGVPIMEAYDAFLQTHLVSDPLAVLSDTNVVIRPLKMSFALRSRQRPPDTPQRFTARALLPIRPP